MNLLAPGAMGLHKFLYWCKDPSHIRSGTKGSQARHKDMSLDAAHLGQWRWGGEGNDSIFLISAELRPESTSLAMTPAVDSQIRNTNSWPFKAWPAIAT